MKGIKLIIISLFSMTLVSCGSGGDANGFSNLKASLTIQGQPEIYDAGDIVWENEWSQHLEKSIERYGSNLLNITIADKDLRAVDCLGFNKANDTQKKQFWVVVFASMAKFESGYRNIQMVPRNAADRARAAKNELPLGLLQLSSKDSWHGNGCHNSQSQPWLLDPLNNLQCGVQIMNNQLSGNRGKYPGVIGRLFPDQPLKQGVSTRHYYWSVLTYGDDGVMTSSGSLRYGKKNKVQERIIDQLHMAENREMFNFCFD